ncbi:MAG TPA: VOC family protein, partial [Candidatus Binataceae bacterium]|nr:VOC family protein [Candidatus Binataceae bacterium]
GQIELRLGVGDPATFENFLAQALGAERIGAGRFKLGQTIVSFKLDAYTVHPADSPPFTNALEVVSRMAAVGIRYMTIQVRDCDAANRELTSRGARPALAPVNLGTVARICFVRDPDGNMIEISQRAGLGNPLPAA